VDQLAQSHQVSSDGLTYTFTLRSGLKFSDGTPLTANDVAYSLNRVLLPATKSSVTNYLDLLKDYDKVTAGKIPTLIGDSIIVKDPTTISLVISKRAAYFLESLTYSTGDVVQRKLVDKYGAKWIDHLEEGAGSGPFEVQSYGHTTSLVLVPNPNYYAFKPKIQKIIYTIGSDRDSNYKAYQAGQYDVAAVPPALDPVAKTKPGFQLVPALASRYIGMNYLVKPLDNIKIRQALDLAINKDLIIARVIGSVVTPSNHIVPNGIPGYNENLTGPDGVAGTAGDQAKAKALFQQGMQEEGYSSVSQLPSLTLNYNVSYQAGANTINAIVAEWKQVLGITVKTVGEQSDQFVQDEDTNFGSKKLQMWYGNWGADYPDAADWLTLFFGKDASHNGFNYGQNTSSAATEQQAVQAEMAQADEEQDAAKRIQLYQDAEQKIVNDVGWITTYQSSYAYSVNPKLQNFKLNSLGSIATSDWANIYFAQ
ncbi:MAG: peptide ABC transporter substrate-binding protein, partial [Ktedonobacteraceae bacterium]|nr:peptide ABC transporter substrate-binding protein [Ktedonobacteraceae bacterium]